MKLTSILPATLLAVGITALPVEKRSSTGFSAIAARSGSPIHLLPINAAGSGLYVGGSPSTYCPDMVDPCPPGNETVFANAFNLLYQYVEVPGGQALFVKSSGAVSYTSPHSISMPSGSQQGPFDWVKGSPFGRYTTTSFGADGFMACPDYSTNTTAWQVFAAIKNATVPTGNVEDCLGFDALTTPYSGSIPTWEYV
ncbi:uncharacterized protein TRUGW13939_04285 [Talaromyces rugulosus]|uniref:IgE-binding protein n=1 Tax=Talaromyces rugulosus TaxID=121627 RepID=A0A7H8QT86_TALRU|nr:uncharacterized protein TRUGW13939_04285 [Talaromyces rugulosus]QKX57177.1 hypothetical protein TRUGW13939_04285 [Talaromyces rugulosus]